MMSYMQQSSFLPKPQHISNTGEKEKSRKIADALK